jgi:hypothetical protein
MSATTSARGKTSGTEPAWIIPSRWLGIALLAMACLHCCPHPPGFVPRTNPECSRWDWTTSRSEIRGLASDLADQLPEWERTTSPSVSLDYKGLKVAAIKMARAPECVRRAVIESYWRAYYKRLAPDLYKTSWIFLLMRVLFVPHATSDRGAYPAGWIRPSESTAADFDLAWPVRADPRGRILEIDRSRGTGRNSSYHAPAEYDYFAAHFRMRTTAEIDALEIRGR